MATTTVQVPITEADVATVGLLGALAGKVIGGVVDEVETLAIMGLIYKHRKDMLKTIEKFRGVTEENWPTGTLSTAFGGEEDESSRV